MLESRTGSRESIWNGLKCKGGKQSEHETSQIACQTLESTFGDTCGMQYLPDSVY